MTRLGIYAAAFAIGLTMLAATVVWFVNVDRDRRALDDARNHIETREDIDNALSADRGCFWLDRLRASCP